MWIVEIRNHSKEVSTMMRLKKSSLILALSIALAGTSVANRASRPRRRLHRRTGATHRRTAPNAPPRPIVEAIVAATSAAATGTTAPRSRIAAARRGLGRQRGLDEEPGDGSPVDMCDASALSAPVLRRSARSGAS